MCRSGSILILMLSLLSPAFGADGELTEVVAEKKRPGLFEIGAMIQGGLPEKYDRLADENGIGAGFGLTAGIRPLSYLSIYAFIDRMDHNADITGSANTEYATNGSVGLGTKIFPMGDSGPRFYGLAGIAITQHWVHEDFILIPEEGQGASFRGTRYSMGAGYEHPIDEKFLVFGEFDMAYSTLDRRVILNRGAFPLTETLTTWTPTVRIGMIANF
jgi:hypothetical protein